MGVERTVSGRDLARWSGWEITPKRAKALAKVESRALSPDDPRYIEAMRVYEESGLKIEVERAGGVVLGAAIEGASGSELAMVYVSLLEGRVRLSVVRRPPSLVRVMKPGASGSYSANYSFQTVFESGHEVITWGKQTVMTPSTERLTSAPGTGHFVADLMEHRRRIQERGQGVVRVHTMEDAVEMTLHYHKHIIPESTISSITLTRWIVGIQVVLLMVALIFIVLKPLFGS